MEKTPKRCYQGKKIDTRMQISALLRETLAKTKEYLLKKESGKAVDYDQKLGAMIPVIKKELPLKCHAHRADDILTVIRIAKEYDIEVTLDHATDARCIVEQIKESGYPCICGPSFGHKTKFELKSKSFKTPGVLNKAGILVSITTDSPVIPEQYLSLCAALAAKEGMDEYEAIKAITINPNKILKLDNRVGSIKAGKDVFDFIICTKNILDTQNEIQSVYINGKKAVVMLFKNATIYTMEEEPFIGDFRVDKGVFTEIGKDLSPKDEEVQDLNGLYVFPGLIDAHTI